MDAAEFADWLAGIERLSGEQMALARAALGEVETRAGVRRRFAGGGRRSPEAAASGDGVGRRGAARIERDALGTIGEQTVDRLGCAHCGADEVIGWGRSHGLPRYRCKCRSLYLI